MSEQIGKYYLLGKINEGGFGECFKGKDEENNYYAIKKIYFRNEEELTSVINEINILKIMKSKYSVEYIDSIKTKDFYYIIMELCDGDLNYLIKKQNGNIDIITIIKILIQLNEVINLMHSKNIIHRDLKLENILIKYINEEVFNIKLTDYGFAKSYEDKSKFSTNVGTKYFKAPEIFLNNGTSKSDLWSIGMIIYKLYFNQIPFKNEYEYINIDDVKLKKSENSNLDDLISKLLIKDPNKRINWDDYFNHPFNKQQIIEIYFNIEKDNTNTKIFNNNYYNYYYSEQFNDSIMYIDEKKNNFITNTIFNKGKHKIIILSKNILSAHCDNIFSNLKDIKEIYFYGKNINLENLIKEMDNVLENINDIKETAKKFIKLILRKAPYKRYNNEFDDKYIDDLFKQENSKIKRFFKRLKCKYNPALYEVIEEQYQISCLVNTNLNYIFEYFED